MIILLIINIFLLLSIVLIAGHIDHIRDEIEDRIDELSMIECKLVKMLDDFAVIMSSR